VGLDAEEAPDAVTFYYDSLLDIHHRLPVRAGLTNAFYLAAQVPEDAQRLFLAASADAGLRRSEPILSNPRVVASALFLAREWGDDDLAARIADAVDQRYEPTWDTATGEFNWGLGLHEEHPRGQFNAFLAAAEAVTEGAWQRFAQRRLPEGPGVVQGVDFPTVALSEARWADGTLHVRLSARTPAVLGSPTSFDVAGLTRPTTWRASGPHGTTSTVSPAGTLHIVTPVGPAPLKISR
jgi:hypothetical protein